MKYILMLLLFVSCASRPPCKGLTHNCKNGDAGACYDLGKAVFNTLGPKNENNKLTKEKSSQWMKKGCDLGHEKSCFEYTQYQNSLN